MAANVDTTVDEHIRSQNPVGAVDRTTFVALYGELFEHSAWIAESAWRASGFATADDMISAMMDVLRAAGREAQLTLLRAHPELAGREAEAGELTAASEAEQLSAGLNRLSREEAREIQILNAAYTTRHGFPFIACVRHYTKTGIFAELRRRGDNDTETEIEEALTHIAYIARIRLGLSTSFTLTG